MALIKCDKVLRLENSVFLLPVINPFLSPFSRFDVLMYAYHLEERRFSHKIPSLKF